MGRANHKNSRRSHLKRRERDQPKPRTIYGLFIDGNQEGMFFDKHMAKKAAAVVRKKLPHRRIDVRPIKNVKRVRAGVFGLPAFSEPGDKYLLKRFKKTVYARDAENPKPGEIYQSKTGNRWLVKGRTPKGRVVLQRTTPKYTGDVYWTPSMLARLKQIRGDEAKAVATAIPKDLREARFPSGASLLDRILNRKPAAGEQLALPGMRDPNRRYYVYVIETLRNGKRSFYVGQTGKKPEQRFKEHKRGHHFSYAKGAKLLRKDLTKKVPPLYTRQQAERAERVIAKTLRKRGLRVTGGH